MDASGSDAGAQKNGGGRVPDERLADYPFDHAMTFGETAILYDRHRPSYPRGLMEAVLENTGASTVLEIGAGTGKATKALLALGRSVMAVEPDQRMATVLAQNCRRGEFQIDPVMFEHALPPYESFEVAVAAQSWHWIDHDIGYQLAADALVLGGRLALMGHEPDTDQGRFGDALLNLYSQLAPHVKHPLPGVGALTDPSSDERALEYFTDWHRLEHRWRRKVTSATLVGWLCSSASHRALTIAERRELMSGVASLVGQFGGTVEIGISTIGYFGYKL